MHFKVPLEHGALELKACFKKLKLTLGLALSIGVFSLRFGLLVGTQVRACLESGKMVVLVRA